MIVIILSTFLLNFNFLFLLFGCWWLFWLWKLYFTLNLIVILKDIAYQLAIGYQKITLFYSQSLYESFFAILITFLVFFYLSVGLFYVR